MNNVFAMEAFWANDVIGHLSTDSYCLHAFCIVYIRNCVNMPHHPLIEIELSLSRVSETQEKGERKQRTEEIVRITAQYAVFSFQSPYLRVCMSSSRRGVFWHSIKKRQKHIHTKLSFIPSIKCVCVTDQIKLATHSQMRMICGLGQAMVID